MRSCGSGSRTTQQFFGSTVRYAVIPHCHMHALDPTLSTNYLMFTAPVLLEHRQGVTWG